MTPRSRSSPGAIDDLRRLRANRAPRERDLSIGRAVHEVEREVKKRAKATGGIGAAWESVVPAALAARSNPVSLARGVLTVRVADSAARFELDRFLRTGGEPALARAAGVAIRRIKLVT